VIVTDPSELQEIFGQDPETHIYGLADLEEPFLSTSTWHREADAVVGVVSTGGDWVTGYAMSRIAPQETLSLLLEVQGDLPPGSWITGPLGMHESMSARRDSTPIGVHWRMVLDGEADTADPGEVSILGKGDLESLIELYDTAPGEVFFLPEMLEHNPFVGIWERSRLVAAAGTHVSSRRHGVAAIGALITRPDQRGRGLGRTVLSGLCRLLADEYETIGLNVRADNTSAISLYDRLGFRRGFQYEEIELL
jgi:ribosomal protein S18 acetylase RimI-like enzyme